MKQKLFDSFQKHFSAMNKKVREEDLLLFLDKKQDSKFDRETFNELELQLKEHNKELTPYNFFGTYYLAHQVVSEKYTFSTDQINQLSKESNELLDDNNAVKLCLENITLRNSQHSQNFVSFEIGGKKVQAFDLKEGDNCFIYLTQKFFNYNKNLTITYKNVEGKSIESKQLKIPFDQSSQQRIKFSDNSSLNFNLNVLQLTQQQAQQDIEQQKLHQEELQDFAHIKKRILEKPFPEIYNRKAYVGESNQSCTTTLMICVILTGIMLMLTFILNFNRCNFIDIFVGIAFFVDIYALRIFNIFTAIRFISVLLVSIIIDIIWETFRLIYYSKNFEAHTKKLRIIGLVLSFILIVLKIIICIFYFRLAREDQKQGYLALRDENSIHEVNEEDYLQQTYKSGMLQTIDLTSTFQQFIQIVF